MLCLLRSLDPLGPHSQRTFFGFGKTGDQPQYVMNTFVRVKNQILLQRMNERVKLKASIVPSLCFKSSIPAAVSSQSFHMYSSV